MELIRRGELFYKMFQLNDANYDNLMQIIIKCYSDDDSNDEIVFMKAVRPEYPNAIRLNIVEGDNTQISCFFSKEFTSQMTLGLWKIEAMLLMEGIGSDIYKPLGDLFYVLPTTINK